LGLLIIMAILMPILELLNQDIDFTAAQFWKTDQPIASFASLQTIQGKSKRLQEHQMQQIQTQWEENMEKLMEDHLMQQFALQHVKVQVKARLQEKKAPQILSVGVKAEIDQNEQKQHHHQPSAIQPVDSIEVELSEEKMQKKQDHALADRIKKYIQHTWRIKADQIDVVAETVS